MAGEYMSSALYWINEIVKRLKWESKMEKLTRLLNEYEEYKEWEYWKKNYKWRYNEEDNWLNAERVDGSELWEEESWAVIICRWYCFIKWLVDGDRIDWDGDYNYRCIEEFDGLVMNDTPHLLIILSIEDNPIEFLSSLLK